MRPRRTRIQTALACLAILGWAHCGGDEGSGAGGGTADTAVEADVTPPETDTPGSAEDIATPPDADAQEAPPDVVTPDAALPDVVEVDVEGDADQVDASPDTTPDVGTEDITLIPDGDEDTGSDEDTATQSPDTGPDDDASPPECVESVDCLAELAASGPCDVVACVDGACVTSQADDGESCDDGDVCTVDDACNGGTCAGAPMDCSMMDAGCMVGACDATSAGCVAVADTDGTLCDDGDTCTQNDSCLQGACQGQPTDCTAFDSPCTTGICDGGTGECTSVWAADGSECDDGDPCSAGDQCAGGVCTASPVVCEAQDDGPCYERVCQPDTGECIAVIVADGTACEDGAACTFNDTCVAGTCVGSSIDCSFLDNGCRTGVCQEPLGNCLEVDAETGTQCDDADPCTSEDLCTEGTCAGTAIDCSDLDAPCVVGECSNFTGLCSPTPQPALSACDDGDPCTVDDICFQNTCQGTTLECDLPDNPCRDGACDPATGTCAVTFVADDTQCDDGLLCTEADHCLDGDCVGTGPDCSGLDEGCLVGICDDENGGCKQVQAEDGTPCDDDLFCTTDDVCTAGTCGGAARVCPDAGPCDLGLCAEDTDSCETEFAVDDAPCDDQDPCTESDTCLGGFCVAVPRDCSELDGPCHYGHCDQTVGECVSETIPNGTSCSDGNFCTFPDSCAEGFCIGEPVDCSSLETTCNTASCDPETGGCEKQAINELLGCNDNSKCTYNDQCTGGVCQGTPYDCSSLSTSCRSASCDPETGACATENEPDGLVCDDDDKCTFEGTCAGGLCQTVALTCTQFGDTCNYGKCDSETGECYADPKPDGAGCSSNNPCLSDVSCSDGVCVGTEKDCSALDGPCSEGYCNSFNGFCSVTNYEEGTGCDDGDSCTGPDTCQSNSCVGLFNLDNPGCDHPCAAPIAVDQNTNLPGIQLPFLYSDTTVGASDDVDTQGCVGDQPYGIGSGDRLFRFDVPSNATYRFRLTEVSFAGAEALNAVLSLHAVACPSLPGSLCDTFVTANNGEGSDALERVLNEDSTVYLVVDGQTAGDAGTFILRVEEVPTTEIACNDNFDDEGDGLTDCDDPDCNDHFECLPVIEDGAVAIIEIMSNTVSPLADPEGEWLELRNPTTNNVPMEHMWLALRTWGVGETEPGAPTAAYKFASGTLWATQHLLLTRAASGPDNGQLTPTATYGVLDLDRTQNMRLQIIRPGWDGVSEPTAAFIIDDLTVPAAPDLDPGRSWQLTVAASEATDVAQQNDNASNWCQSPDFPEIEYATGNFGTPTGGGANGSSGLVSGLNQSCD